MWKNREVSVHLPTVLKSSNVDSTCRLEKVLVGDELETSSCYKAVSVNKRQLLLDMTTKSGRHLDAFSQNRSEIMCASTVLEMMPPSGFAEIDSCPVVADPSTRMPNTQRISQPPPLYNQNRSDPRNNRNQPPPRYQSPQQNQMYVYYPPDRRAEPENTRDLGPYRPGRRNPTRQLVDRQSSDDYLFEKQLRKIFVCKVYLILSLLLLFSFTGCLITTMVTEVRNFFIEYWWIGIIFIILYLFFSVALMCCTNLRRSFPTNMILLFCMCVCITIPMCVATAMYSTKTVLLALGTTVLITLTVSLLAKVSPFDVTGCGMLVCILALVFSLYGMVTFIVSLFIYEPLMHLIYGAIGTVLFSFFLFFDTQQILGGRRVELSPEEYILGVVLLYIDIIMIFLMLLNVYGYGE